MNAASAKRDGGGGATPKPLNGDEHRLLNSKEVADWLGVSYWTVQTYWKTGELGSVKLGSAPKSPRRSTVAQVRAFIANNTVDP